MDPRFIELAERLQRHPGRSLNLPGLELRDSAVLVPFLVRGGVPHLLFTLRPAHLRRHPGQVSFPGGVRDPGDATPLHTALREMREELGVPERSVEVLGMLDHDEPGVLLVDIDPDLADKARAAIPALKNARPFTGPGQ